MAAAPFKKTSSLLRIGGSVTESAVGTWTEAEINLPLNTLDREVFVVTDVAIAPSYLALVAGQDATFDIQVTKTEAGNLTSIADPNVIGKSYVRLYDSGAGTAIMEDRYPQNESSTGTPKDFIAVIATPDFWVGCVATNQAVPRGGQVMITGFRATATSDLYAALVTEELNN